jgi:hypothetical protein
LRLGTERSDDRSGGELNIVSLVWGRLREWNRSGRGERRAGNYARLWGSAADGCCDGRMAVFA